jgi:hypothetical protein
VATALEQALERRAAAQAAAEQQPDNPAAWIALSHACQAVSDYEGTVSSARRAVQLQPDNVDALRHLASNLFQVGPGPIEARPLFERLLKLVPRDPVALHYLYYYAMFDGDYRRAAELSETLDQDHPGDPSTAARIARAYGLMGHSVAAAEYFSRAADRCANEHHPFPHGPYASLKPVFTALAGHPDLSEQLSLQLCQDSGIGLANLSNPKYPDDCAASIKRLQERVAGRDVYLFGFGPSLSEVVARKFDLVPLDFASMTLSSFPLIDDDLLRPIGRRIEFVCLTHWSMVSSLAAEIREWMLAVPSSILIVPLVLREYAMRSGGPEFLVGRSDHLFWFDAFNDHLLPSPGDPLHFPPINTVICALAVAVLARSRRIFLFGFDGQMKGKDLEQAESLYYRDGHKAYFAPRRTEIEVRRMNMLWLWWDSMRFNETAPVVLRHTALLFDLPLPPIYNVCIDSALNSFPRITFDRFLEIAASQGTEP